VTAKVPVPASIFCPRCGAVMPMERIRDAPTVAKLKESGYAAGARGRCGCGVFAILTIKRLPENPTFTLMFNIFRLRRRER